MKGWKDEGMMGGRDEGIKGMKGGREKKGVLFWFTGKGMKDKGMKGWRDNREEGRKGWREEGIIGRKGGRDEGRKGWRDEGILILVSKSSTLSFPLRDQDIIEKVIFILFILLSNARVDSILSWSVRGEEEVWEIERKELEWKNKIKTDDNKTNKTKQN